MTEFESHARLVQAISSMKHALARKGKTEDEAEEALQDACLRMLEASHKNAGWEPKCFGAYACKVALNALIERRRSKRNSLQLPAQDGFQSTHESPVAELVRREALAGMRVALMALPAIERVVLEMQFLSGCSIPQIAGVFCVTPTNVRTVRRRALRRMRRIMEAKLILGAGMVRDVAA